MSVARDIEGDVDAVGAADARIDFVFEPVLRDHALHALHVPGEPITEVAPAAPGVRARTIKECRVAEQNEGDPDRQPQRPGKSASPPVMLKVDVSACCHSAPEAG